MPIWTILVAVLTVAIYFQHLPGIPPIWPGILTFHFSHASPEHLLQNVMTLLIFGIPLEQKIGWKVIPILFISSTIGGLSTIFAGGGRGLSAGIFGIMGYMLAEYPGIDILNVPGGAFAFAYSLYNLFFQASGISALAHAIGFITGMMLSKKKDSFTYFVAGINVLAAILWVVRFA